MTTEGARSPEASGQTPKEGTMYEHMNLEQLEAYVGMAAQGIDAAIENGEGIDQAKQVYAEALNAYRLRSN